MKSRLADDLLRLKRVRLALLALAGLGYSTRVPKRPSGCVNNK